MKYVKIFDSQDKSHWVDMDKVEAVTGEIVESGGGLDIKTVSATSVGTTSPRATTFIMTLHMVSGSTKEIRFQTAEEFDKYCRENFKFGYDPNSPLEKLGLA